ncbi:MAG: helix-hairpin-helix domain-containing protein [Spartobacteria bacterium]
MVQTSTGDLGEQLIENGLARIHGASANPIGLPRANVHWQKLQQLERGAKAEKVGGWGVNFGRMLAEAQSAKSRAGADPFDAFFHPDRVAPGAAAPAASAWPFPKPTPIPTAAVARSTSTSALTSNGNKLDVNSATQEQLEDIPGIGETLAARIIAARPFKGANALRGVKGSATSVTKKSVPISIRGGSARP